MPTETLDEVLEHYGILGMRWGVRRSDEEIARDNQRRMKKGKKVTVSTDAAKVSKARSKEKEKGISSLTNQELEMVNRRLNLETQYDRLTADRPKELSTGQKVVRAILPELGNLGANVARSEGQRLLIKYLRKSVIGV